MYRKFISITQYDTQNVLIKKYCNIHINVFPIYTSIATIGSGGFEEEAYKKNALLFQKI